jgi:hypothetical protein
MRTGKELRRHEREKSIIRMNRKLLLITSYFLFTFAGMGYSVEEEGKIISYLKEMARALTWDEDVLVGVKSPREDFRVFGIANVPFHYLDRMSEKSYLQWLVSDHLFPLEQIFEKHIKVYEKFNYQQNRIENLGLKAYRAYQVSYTPEDKRRLVLNKTVDVVEILTDRLLLTVRDERVQVEANAVKILEGIYPMLSQRVMESLPAKLPASVDQKTSGPRWPVVIDVEKILPYPSDLESKTEGAWRKKAWQSKHKRGSFFSKSAVYEMINDEGNLEDKIRVSVFSYGTQKESEIVLDSLETGFKTLKKRTVSKSSPQEIWIYRENEGAERVLFARGVFVVEIRFLSKDVREPRRTDRLKIFQKVLEMNIDGLFSTVVRD